MSWQPEYALLIGLTTLSSYSFGLISNSDNPKRNKQILRWSVAVSLGVLILFKYFDFFNHSIKYLVSQLLNLQYGFEGFNFLLPIGISFYTFQTISYNLDVYYGVRQPERHLGKYAVFVSFFPQLVAGPIERSTDLLPQFHIPVKFNWLNIEIGIRYIIWGLFKKMVIADRLLVYVDKAYNDPYNADGASVFFATVLFAFQLYCDFSAYSDIARGSAKLLGIELSENFNHPFKSKNITDFWRRWHITLSTWLRDYLYTPIVFNKKKWGKKAVLYAITVTFILCGLWHGPKFTYVIFGILQAGALIYELLTADFRKKLRNSMNTAIYDRLSIFFTLLFVLFSFIFFRANDTSEAIEIVKSLFQFGMGWNDEFSLISGSKLSFSIIIILLLAFIVIDEFVFKMVKEKTSLTFSKTCLIFLPLSISILLFGFFGKVEFIYFQF